MDPHPAVSTSSLLTACAAPERDTPWNQLYRLESPRVRAGVLAALARCGERGDPDLVDDLVQEVWCRLLDRGRRARPGFRGGSDAMARSYLRRVAQTVVVDALRGGGARKRRPRQLLSLSGLGDLEWLPSDRSACPERRLLARERLVELLKLCRRAVGPDGGPLRLRIARLGLIEGWTTAEIRRALPGRWTERAIDSILFRMRQRLQELGLRLPRRPGGLGARPCR